MYKMMEQGRSMIEMLGVLAIVGVLSVGGLKVIGEFQSNLKSTQIVNDFVDFVRMSRKLACQFDEGYDTSPSGVGYMYMIRKNNAYPSHFKTKEGDHRYLYGVNNVTYYAVASEHYPKKMGYLVSNLSENDCIRLATTDLGYTAQTGFISFFINSADDKKAVSGTSSYPMSLSKATELCSKKTGNSLAFDYTGCI